MPIFKATNALDKVFEISILLKAFDGLLETVAGLLLFFVHPQQITHFARWITLTELHQNTNEFWVRHFLHSANQFALTGGLFAAIYLLTHGIVKIFLVAAILKEQLWAYKAMIIFLLLFIVYQVYKIIQQPTTWIVLLTIFDIFIVLLTMREDKRQHQLMRAKLLITDK